MRPRQIYLTDVLGSVDAAVTPWISLRVRNETALSVNLQVL